MKKDEMIDILSECVMVEVSMECENCHAHIYNGFVDESDLAKEAYKKGWRYKDDKCLCPKCVKQLK